MSRVATIEPVGRNLADDSVDVGGVWRALKRRKGLILGVTAVCFGASVAYITVTKPRFTAEAKLLVESPEAVFSTPDTPGVAPDPEAVASQVQLVQSRDLARQAIKKLGLQGNPEYDPLASGEGALSRILSLLGVSRSRAHLSPEDRILDNYYERMSVFAVPKSRVLTIEFSSRDADLAALGANTIADLYLDVQGAAKRDRARSAATSLATLVADLRSKLAEAESRVETFRANSGLLMGANNATIPSQQLAEISTQLAAARTTMADAQAKARLIRGMIRSGSLEAVPDVAKDDLVRRISEQRTGVRGRLALESQTLGPAHPRIKELQAQLVSLDRELRAAAEKIARSLENEARVASVRVDNLLAAIDAQKKQVGSGSADNVRLRELELEAKLLREQLEANTTRYREALARQEAISLPGDARVISRAVAPPKPSFPKPIPIVAFATLAGLAFSAFGVVAAELLSARPAAPTAPVAAPTVVVADGSQAARAILPGVGERPDVEPPDFPGPGGASRRQAQRGRANPLPAVARLATKLAAADTRGYGRRVLVSVAVGGVSQINAALPLARALAATKRVVLVDFSHTVPTGAPGMSDLMAGAASFADCIERDEAVASLHLIAAGDDVVAIGPDIDTLLDALSRTYDFVMLGCPTLDADPARRLERALAPASDFGVVATAAETPASVAQSLRASLSQEGVASVHVLCVDDALAARMRAVKDEDEADAQTAA